MNAMSAKLFHFKLVLSECCYSVAAAVELQPKEQPKEQWAQPHIWVVYDGDVATMADYQSG